MKVDTPLSNLSTCPMRARAARCDGSPGPGAVVGARTDGSYSGPYQYMVPVFGEGIQYGAPLAVERQQVKFLSNALRPAAMQAYSQVIANEEAISPKAVIDAHSGEGAFIKRDSDPCMLRYQGRQS